MTRVETSPKSRAEIELGAAAVWFLLLNECIIDKTGVIYFSESSGLMVGQ